MTAAIPVGNYSSNPDLPTFDSTVRSVDFPCPGFPHITMTVDFGQVPQGE